MIEKCTALAIARPHREGEATENFSLLSRLLPRAVRLTAVRANLKLLSLSVSVSSLLSLSLSLSVSLECL